MKLLALLLSVSLLFPGIPAHSQEEDSGLAKSKKLADGLNYQKGEITLRDGLARIHVPPGFRFIDAADSNTVLSKIWGNPPNTSTLGMLVPSDLSVASRDAWGVIITYDEDGYVKDDDAAKNDYDKILKQMQDRVRGENAEREKEGYAPVELVGWATPPRYDKATHKMYWAKELKFGDSAENTLNYNIRILGRKGVLVLNAVASMSQLREIEQAAPQILAMVDFQQGNRYVDFNKSTDKVATYGIAALVAGGVLAKVGAFKALIPILLAAKKLVIVGVVAVAAFFKRLFGRKQASQ